MNNRASVSTGCGGIEPRGPIVFRCDADAETGLGHLIRSMALAEACEEIGHSSVFMGRYSPAARALLAGVAMPFENVPALAQNDEAAESLRAIEKANARWVIFDSYRISPDHLAAFSNTRVQAGVIDDFAHLSSYPCAFVLNFTVNAKGLSYPPSGPRYLLGPKYFLARRRLRRLRAQSRRRRAEVRRLLVAIGGTDRHGLARRVVQALSTMAPQLVLRVATGFGEVEGLAQELAQFAEGSGALDTQPDLADEFAAADACISGGGLTKYESAYLGVPGAVISQTSEQADETKYFARHGLAYDLGLGPDLPQPELVGRLREFLANRPLRENLARTGVEIFPDDPTRYAAETLVNGLFQASRLSATTRWPST